MAAAMGPLPIALCQILDKIGSEDSFFPAETPNVSLPGPPTPESIALEDSLRRLVARFQDLEQKSIQSPPPDDRPITKQIQNVKNSAALEELVCLSCGSRMNAVPLTPEESPALVESTLPRSALSSSHSTYNGYESNGSVSTETTTISNPSSNPSPDAIALAAENALLKAEIRQLEQTIAEIAKTHVLETQKLRDDLQETQKVVDDYVLALKEISTVTKSVSSGDLSQRITLTPRFAEVASIKTTINEMVERLGTFSKEVTRVAKQVGTDGILGAQATVQDVSGVWLELTNVVNTMANNLTDQVREIAKVTTAVAKGDLEQVINVKAEGEIKELKVTINQMVETLRVFSTEVTRIAREVGTEGRLGGTAKIDGVEGVWKDLTNNVNQMATNLTQQVRDVANVTTAVARGDLSKTITVTARGEIDQLKQTVNNMVAKLNQFSSEVTRVAREVGTEGRLGGQAKIEGVEGTWKELTDNVNTMADRLTHQVRSIANVTTAISLGDLSQQMEVDAQGEILSLAETINNMIRRLNNFGNEVCRVAREVGIEGRLGVQADVQDVEGLWKEITSNVNDMANNLTAQVRAFADITSGAGDGSFGFITVEASGEMDNLKKQINSMVINLRASIQKDKQAREAAELANRSKSEFLANMSHEIRTPMNGIIGLSSLTLEEKDGQLNPSQKENLQTVLDLASGLMLIIDDILDISKIEANRMDVESAPFSLRSALCLALNTISVKASQKDLPLIVDLEPGLPDQVVGDALRLRQVISNLLSNAVKFTDEGQVILSLNLADSMPGDDRVYVKVAVTDTGIGIERDKIDVIFENFRQADGSITRKFGGTGLGLSICKQLVHLMGGTLKASSIFGEGSVFEFTLPLEPVKMNLDEVLHYMAPFYGRVILYLDSHYDDTGAADLMRSLGLQVCVTHTQAEAFKISFEQSFDTVVVDAVDFVRPVRAHARLSSLPIVLLSKSGPIRDLNKSLAELGISCIYTTPTNPVDLYPPLMAALQSKEEAAKVDGMPFDVLLAEDNPVNRNIAIKFLKGHHHKVDAVENGQEAYEAFCAKKYDVILMDVQMPVMSGFEATALIRKHEMEHGITRPVPVIALTAHAMIGYREKCLEAGMNEYLTKPLDKKLLLSMVHKCATTVPVLHPNLTKIIDVTPDTELGNPLDNTLYGSSWQNPNNFDSRQSTLEREHNQMQQEHAHPHPHVVELRRPSSRGNLFRASTSPG